jgi:hypothetical protein
MEEPVPYDTVPSLLTSRIATLLNATPAQPFTALCAEQVPVTSAGDPASTLSWQAVKLGVEPGGKPANADACAADAPGRDEEIRIDAQLPFV